jgi:hypothetical protein
MFATLLTLRSTMEVSKSLIRAVPCDIYAPIYESGKTKCASLRMKWIVVNDRDGTRRLQMHWRSW